jgi:hypothetical protein
MNTLKTAARMTLIAVAMPAATHACVDTGVPDPM